MDFRFSRKTIYHVRTEMRRSLTNLIFLQNKSIFFSVFSLVHQDVHMHTMNM